MNEIIELTLSGMAYGGEAIGRDSSGRMTFVPYALPGERVRVEILQARKSWARAHLLDVLEPSPERIKPRCKHFTHCGGCHYQHLDYANQLIYKHAIVGEQLARVGGILEAPLRPVVPSAQPWSYRNNMRFSLTREGRLGLKAAASDQAFALEECFLPLPPIADLWPQLDLEAVPGLQSVSVRCGVDQLILFQGKGNPDFELSTDLPGSIVWLGPGGTAVLAGDSRIVIEILQVPFLVSAASFFQVNPGAAEALVGLVLEALGPLQGKTIFDLYAGAGLFSRFLAGAGARVIAVEESPSACSDFEVNLDAFDEVLLYEATVDQALPAIDLTPDAILLDPPRSGLGAPTVALLAERQAPLIVYVSCDPATLARDGQGLQQGGYQLEQITPLDMFPQTYHIETISIWRRAR